MTHKLIEIYEAMESLDKEEGRGANRHIAYFRERLQAELAASGQGPQGLMGPVANHSAIEFDDGQVYVLAYSTPVVLESDGRVLLRRRALAKLTKAERNALGYE